MMGRIIGVWWNPICDMGVFCRNRTKTSEDWPRYFPHRSKRAKPDRRGVHAAIGMAISALANVSFSSESAYFVEKLFLDRGLNC